MFAHRRSIASIQAPLRANQRQCGHLVTLCEGKPVLGPQHIDQCRKPVSQRRRVCQHRNGRHVM